MGHYLRRFRESIKKGDSVLLFLCVITTAFGILVISSATNASGNSRYVIVQTAAALLGIFAFLVVSTIDAEFYAEHRNKLIIFNVVLLLMLIPFGVDYGSGNKSWLALPLMPVDIQPAEICKITFIVILASVMAANQNKISSFKSVIQMGFQFAILAGLNMVLSGDLGVTLIFLFIFIGMAFTGGVSYLWFIAAGGGIVAIAPIFWNYFLDNYQSFSLTDNTFLRKLVENIPAPRVKCFVIQIYDYVLRVMEIAGFQQKLSALNVDDLSAARFLT